MYRTRVTIDINFDTGGTKHLRKPTCNLVQRKSYRRFSGLGDRGGKGKVGKKRRVLIDMFGGFPRQSCRRRKARCGIVMKFTYFITLLLFR